MHIFVLTVRHYTLTVTGNNTTGLVGVAISASLLPPAVNTGLFWCVKATV